MAAIPQAPTSILAVSTDRTMSLYDVRSVTSTGSLSSSAAATFMHPATPSCVVASENNAHQLVSGAYDGIVRVWDVRSTKGAISSFKAWDGGKKVLPSGCKCELSCQIAFLALLGASLERRMLL